MFGTHILVVFFSVQPNCFSTVVLFVFFTCSAQFAFTESSVFSHGDSMSLSRYLLKNHYPMSQCRFNAHLPLPLLHFNSILPSFSSYFHFTHIFHLFCLSPRDNPFITIAAGINLNGRLYFFFFFIICFYCFLCIFPKEKKLS